MRTKIPKSCAKSDKFSNARLRIAVNIGSEFIASLYDPKGKFGYFHDALNKLMVEFAATKDASFVKIPPSENTVFTAHPTCNA